MSKEVFALLKRYQQLVNEQGLYGPPTAEEIWILDALPDRWLPMVNEIIRRKKLEAKTGRPITSPFQV